LLRTADLPWINSAWRSGVRIAFRLGLLAMLWLLTAGPLDAYTFARVALYSNILVDNGRVIFIQGTGSLTVLDLESGNVLLRKKLTEEFWYSGKLQRSGDAVLMMGYDRIALLGGKTFDPIWQAAQCYDAVADGAYVVSHDGRHTITCRTARSGQQCWKVVTQDGWRLVAARGKLLVTTPHYGNRRPDLLVLDLESGSRVLRHEAPSGVRWRQVYFDGTRVYIVDDKSVDPREPDPKPTSLTTLDLQGKILERVDWSSPEIIRNTSKRWIRGFIWDNMFFDENGRLVPLSAHQRKTLLECWKREDWRAELFPSGLLVGVPTQDAAGETGQTLRVVLPNGSWTAYAPHLGQHGEVTRAVEADGKLLLGTTEGQVECMDLQTGRPRWLYTFPVPSQTMSYSVPYGMPPYLTQQAAEYEEAFET
jgi:outer membrane protein assembly factor BamB